MPHDARRACGFEFSGDAAALATRCDAFPGVIDRLLTSADGVVLRRRPTPTVWSPIEYAVHLEEAMRWYATRIRRVLNEEVPQLTAYDFDTAVEEGSYDSRAVEVVVDAVRVACRDLAECVRALRPDQMSRRGLGSDGSIRTLPSLLSRAEHELVHHELDLRHGLGLPLGEAEV